MIGEDPKSQPTPHQELVAVLQRHRDRDLFGLRHRPHSRFVWARSRLVHCCAEPAIGAPTRGEGVRATLRAVENSAAPAEPVWRYRQDVWRLATQLCRHRQDAEDVTHSALLKAAQHLDEFRWEASLRTWLHRVATNECRMLHRRKAPLSLEAMLEQAATAEHPPQELQAQEPGPEEVAVEAETRRQVLAALEIGRASCRERV